MSNIDTRKRRLDEEACSSNNHEVSCPLNIMQRKIQHDMKVEVIAVFSVSKQQGLVSHGKAALSVYMKGNSISREERIACSAFVRTEVKKDALKPDKTNGEHMLVDEFECCTCTVALLLPSVFETCCDHLK